MSRTLNALILILQLLLTFLCLWIIYMVFALFDYQGGIADFLGITLIQPLIGAIVSLLTILVCFAIGLPIRLKKKINEWWIKHYYLALAGMMAGFALIFLSQVYSTSIKFISQGTEVYRKMPDLYFLFTGWFLSAFSLLHLYPSFYLIEEFEKFVEKLKIKRL